MAQGINIKFPFEETLKGGVFATNRTTAEALRDDLVALLTLKRGHRPMRSTMFSPIYDFIMEPLDDVAQSDLKREITKKVEEFIPQIEIKEVKFTPKPDENLLEIAIRFGIQELFGAEQTVVLNMPTEDIDSADVLR